MERRMIDFTSVDGQCSFTLAQDLDENRVNWKHGSLQTTCLLRRERAQMRVDCMHDLGALSAFAAELRMMHRNLQIGTQTSLWDLGSALIVRVTLVDRGAVTVRCMMVKPGRGVSEGMSASLVIDQTYLPALAEGAEKLGRCGARRPGTA